MPPVLGIPCQVFTPREFWSVLSGIPAASSFAGVRFLPLRGTPCLGFFFKKRLRSSVLRSISRRTLSPAPARAGQEPKQDRPDAGRKMITNSSQATPENTSRGCKIQFLWSSSPYLMLQLQISILVFIFVVTIKDGQDSAWSGQTLISPTLIG